MRQFLENLLPISILLVVVVVVIRRLPRIDLGHSEAFKRRRVFNWLPLGLTYAMLYMGRYNLTVAKNALGDLMTKEDFGIIFGVGTVTYGVSFLINGPLADKFGGRATMLAGALGSAVMNVAMGVVIYLEPTSNLRMIFTVLYAINMYFQSFGAVSIVKVNAAWFHVRERGVFGGIFGILISLGIYFAFDIGKMIVDAFSTSMVFFVPAGLLLALFVVDWFLVRDTPAEAGQKDFDTADASSGDNGPRLPVFQVAKLMLANPIVVTIALIEFCSGYLRNAIMHWYPIMAKETGGGSFVADNWGLLLCCAGIMGGVFAGVVSDRLFQSRRGPSAGILYGAMVVGSLLLFVLLDTPALGWMMVFMSLCIIGVHGMLSGTASMDFGGKKNVGVAVGLIDGMVYLGTGLQALLLGVVLPSGEAQKVVGNWMGWPMAMAPLALIGFLLSLRIWNARPQKRMPPGPSGETSTAGTPQVAEQSG